MLQRTVCLSLLLFTQCCSVALEGAVGLELLSREREFVPQEAFLLHLPKTRLRSVLPTLIHSLPLLKELCSFVNGAISPVSLLRRPCMLQHSNRAEGGGFSHTHP